MQTEDKTADEPIPCQPHWVAHNRFLFYCARSGTAPVARTDGDGAPAAPCTRGSCLFKLRG